jgi:hypothetical protein
MAQIKIQPYENELDYLLQHAVENELKYINYGISKTEKEMNKLEDIYNLDSDEFYQKYQAGLLGDDFVYIKWAGEYETLKKLNHNCAMLKEIDIVS